MRHLITFVLNCFMNYCVRTCEARNPSNNTQSKLGVYHSIFHRSIEIVDKHHSGSTPSGQPSFFYFTNIPENLNYLNCAHCPIGWTCDTKPCVATCVDLQKSTKTTFYLVIYSMVHIAHKNCDFLSIALLDITVLMQRL